MIDKDVVPEIHFATNHRSECGELMARIHSKAEH